MLAITVLLILIAIALVFEYINGFHDSANSIATVVSTKALTPRTAVMYGALMNFVGAFAGTHVAKTISKGILLTDHISQVVIIAALLGAIIWNLFTWYFGIPSSSSHALIGGLMGAGIVHSGLKVVNIVGVTEKVLIPMVTSPVIGFVIGFIFMLIFVHIFYKAQPEKVNKKFKKVQLLTSGIMAFSHGSNDAQKTMGIITLSLFSMGWITGHNIPFWVVLLCASTMALGTMAGGWKIIRTMGSKVIKLKPIHGIATDLASSSVILTATHFGIPISTTHVITTSIMGVGSTLKLSAVKWDLVKNIIMAWIFTIPICMVISGFVYYTIIKIAGLF